MLRTTLVVISLAALIGRAEAQDRSAPAANPPAATPPAGAEGTTPLGAPSTPALPPLPAHLQKTPTPKSPPPQMALASWSNGQLFLRLVLPFPRSVAAGGAGANAGGA